MLKPQKKPDLYIIRGDNTNIDFSASGVDLTGCTLFFTAKPELTNDTADETAVIRKEVTSHTDPTNGKTTIILTHEDTNVEPGTYYYDIQIKNPDGEITSISARRLQVFADVTRRIT